MGILDEFNKLQRLRDEIWDYKASEDYDAVLDDDIDLRILDEQE